MWSTNIFENKYNKEILFHHIIIGSHVKVDFGFTTCATMKDWKQTIWTDQNKLTINKDSTKS